MKNLTIIFYSLLCGWFVLGYCGTSLTIQVEITQFSVATILLFFLLLGLFGYIRKWKYNDLSALSVVVIWGINQYYEHWQPLFFGSSPERVRRYYNYFKGTVRIFPEEQNRIVPDVYHIVFGLLIFICTILLLTNIIILLKDTLKRKLPA